MATADAPPAEPAPELLVPHAVGLKGMADDAEVAARFGLDPALAAELLLDSQAMGRLSRFEFAGPAGWALTDAGRGADERQLAEELALTDSASTVREAYAAFLPQHRPAPPSPYGLAVAAHRGRPAGGQ